MVLKPELASKALEWIEEVVKELKGLRQRMSDLETIIDEIPNLGALIAAVQELQEQHDAPAMKFTHYLGGYRK